MPAPVWVVLPTYNEAAWLVPALRWRRWAADSGEAARVPMT